MFSIIRLEVDRIRQSCILKAINLAIFFVGSRVVLFACFVTFIYMGGTLSAEAVFVTMGFFNILRLTVIRHMPQGIAYTAEALVACRRIQVNEV